MDPKNDGLEVWKMIFLSMIFQGINITQQKTLVNHYLFGECNYPAILFLPHPPPQKKRGVLLGFAK